MQRTMNVLRGPRRWSARRAGTIRPGMPTALNIRRIVRLVEDVVWIMLVAKTLICGYQSLSLTSGYIIPT